MGSYTTISSQITTELVLRNITDGFDRTFGAQYFYFNKGPSNAKLNDLSTDALKYASPADFHNSIAEYVPNYVPSSGRGSWRATIKLQMGAVNPIVDLAQNGVDFQDNGLRGLVLLY